MNKYVIINGAGGVGKDTFVNKCKIYKDNILNISTVDYIKSVAKYCGWDGKKDDRGRKLLSDLKDALTSYDDIPIKNIMQSLEMLDNSIVFIHSREPNEIRRLKNQLNAKTLLIRNKNVEKVESNHADRDVENFQYDYVVENDGTLGDLIMKCFLFLRWLEYADD